MAHPCTRPGDTIVKCAQCEHQWPYSGYRDQATCPTCGRDTDVMDNQKGMVITSDEDIRLEIDQYSQFLRRLLVLGLKSADREYRSNIADEFTTLDGDSRES